jgi:hypothetical protein
MSKLHVVDQGTEAWWKLRRGIPTASQFHKIITPTGKPSAQARPYLYKLVAERLLNETMEDNTNTPWMEWGKQMEAEAIIKFQEKKELILERISFVTSDDGRIGCSPDCLVKGSVEAVEIKCPAPWTQMGYLLDGPGNDYRPQVQGQLLVGSWEAVHFFAYHPRMPSRYDYTQRDKAYIKLMDDLLDKFCDDLDEQTEKARALGDYIPLMREDPAMTMPGVFPWRDLP